MVTATSRTSFCTFVEISQQDATDMTLFEKAKTTTTTATTTTTTTTTTTKTTSIKTTSTTTTCN